MDWVEQLGKCLKGMSASFLSVENASLINTIERAGLINVDSIYFTISLPPQNGKSVQLGKTLISANVNNAARSEQASELVAPQLSTLVLDFERPWSDVSAPSSIEFARPLPFQSGTYLRFGDQKWWLDAPKYFDIAPKVRIVTLTSPTESFPSIEVGDSKGIRDIEVVCHGDAISVKRSQPEFVEFSDTPRRGRRRSVASGSEKWSLRPIAPSRITSLDLKSSNIVVEYERDFATGVWCLINHHISRGDEAYLLLSNA